MNDFKKRLEKMEPSKRRDFLLSMPTFLVGASESDRLQKLLMNFDFIAAKILIHKPEPVVADYDLALDFMSDFSDSTRENLKLIRGVLSLSSGVLTDDPSQLAGHLLGRLSHYTLQGSLTGEVRASLSLSKTSESLINFVSILLMSPLLVAAFILAMTDYIVSEILIITKLKRRTKTLKLASLMLHLPVSVLANFQVKLQNFLLYMRLVFIDIPLFLYYKNFYRGPVRIKGQKKRSRIKDNAEEKYSDIEKFLEKIGKSQSDPWLRPLTPSLTMPGSSLVGFLNGAPRYSSNGPIVISPDGKYVLTDTLDGKLAVWDFNKRTLLKILSGHKSDVTAIAIRQKMDNSIEVISGSGDKSLISWDLETGNILKTFIGHTSTVNTVAIVVDPQSLRPYIISGSHDTNLIIWDLQSGEKLRTLTGHTKGINEIAITPDGKRLVSASDDETLIIWDLQEELPIRVLTGHNKYVNSVVVTPDGNRIISGSAGDSDIIIWDLNSGEILGRDGRESYLIQSIAIIPNSQKFVTASSKGSFSSENNISIWDISEFDSMGSVSFRREKTIGRILHISTVAVTPDGRFIVSDSTDNLSIWDLDIRQGGREVSGHNNDGSINSVTITPDGRYAVTASDDQTLRIWELSSGIPLKSFENGNGCVKWISITADGERVVSLADEITIWDLRTGFPLEGFANRNEANVASLSSEGYLALWGGVTREMVVLDLNTGQEVEHLTKFIDFEDGDSGSTVKFIPDSDDLIVGCYRNMIIWDGKTGDKKFTLSSYSNGLCAIAITLDGKILASASENIITIWDLKSLTVLRVMIGHTKNVRSLAISSNGKYLVSTSWDKTVRVWNLLSGIEILKFTGEESMYSCALSPDGMTIVAGGSIGRVHFLRLENFELSLID